MRISRSPWRPGAFLLLAATALGSLPLIGCGTGDGNNNQQMQQPMAGPFVVPPNDPFLAQLWHLLNGGGGLFVAGEDVRAQTAWMMMTGAPAEPVTGRGVRVVVIDDGLRQAHEDLAANVLVGAGGTYNAMGTLINNDPTPGNPNDQHGTSVAGVAGAVGHNGIGVTGVAPRCSLVGLVNAGGVLSDVAAMVKDITSNHIYNMSYGPTEDGSYTLTAMIERDAITTGITMGRGGRGAVYLRAAGNGGEQTDPGGGDMRWGHHSNLDGFNNEYGVIVVSSSDGAGGSPDYNQCGACITCCAPSSGNPGGITTTDLMGSPINDLGDWYTTQFGGTSSSCPAVAGVVALVLQVNPNLTWRDVRRLLAITARQNSPGAGWVMNGAGEMVHHKYGYGVVDAGAAVTAAPGFTTLGPAVVAAVASATDNVNMMVADNMPAGGITRMLNVMGMPMSTDQIVLRLNLNTMNLRDHRVVLTSPAGTASTLLEPQPLKGGPAMAPGMLALNGEIRLCSLRTMGENPNGMWTLTVTDEVMGRETMGTFVSWFLDVYAD